MARATNRLPAMVIAGLMAFVLAACGGAAAGGNTTVGSTPAASTQPAAAATAAPAAQPTAATEAQQPTAADVQQPTAANAQQPTAAAETAPTSQPSAAAAPARLNLNEVTEDQLLSTIPNFSNRMVREFFEYRPYISIQQFRKEIGKYVSAEQVAAYEQYVYVPVDVDQADAATLQQLPGVDAAIAETLIAGRPYGSNQAFLDKLAPLVSAADLQQATAYLAQ